MYLAAALALFGIVAWLFGERLDNIWYADAPKWKNCDQDCVDAATDLFETFDYPEYKDLAKTFLTLLSATLVASIAFAEKVVDVNRAASDRRCAVVRRLGAYGLWDC